MTLISRPRLWITALLAALSLMAFVSLRARRSDAQDKEDEKPAVQRSPSGTNTEPTTAAESEMLILDLNNGNFIVRIPVTANMLRSPGIRSDSLVDVYYERLGELEPETERINKLFTDVKVESVMVARGAKADSTPHTIGLVLKSKQADTLKFVLEMNKMRLDSKQCEVFLKLAESSQEASSDRTQTPSSDAKEIIHDGDGKVVVPMEKSLAEIKKAIRDCEYVSISFGVKNVILSILPNTNRMRLAEKIFEATKDDNGVQLISGGGPSGKYLMIRTPQKDLKQPEVQVGGKIAQAVIAALMGGADDANTKIPEAAVGGSFSGGGFGGGGPTTGGLFGGGLGGGGGAFQSSQSTIVFSNDVVAIPKEAIGSQQIVVGGNLAIVASNKHDMLWGYSEPLGKWFKQPVSLVVEGLVPVVGANVAAVIPGYKTKPDKKTYFAFSSASGRWGKLEVSLNASDPIIHAKMVVVTDGETTHVFKNDTGKWSTPTALVADNVVPNEPVRSPLIGTPALRHSYEPAVLTYSDGQGVYLFDLDADGTLDVVPVEGMKSSISDENLPDDNHSVVETWRRFLEAAGERREAMAERATLQESLGPKHPAIVRLNKRLAELEEEEQDWNSRLKAFAPPASFERVTVIDWQSRLKSDLQQAEHEAEQAARAMKAPKNSRDKDQAQARLRESIGKAFAARQTLQQLEAELLRERLRQVDDRLQERGRLRDRIIQRRVEELTNSNLDWGASEPLSPGEPVDGVAPGFHGMLYFEAAWCGPCQKLNPILRKLEREGLKFRRIDTDKDRHLVQQFHVTSIPTFIRCLEGREVQRMEGIVAEDQIREMISGAPRYKMVPTQTIPPTTVPPPQSKSKGNFHLLGESPTPIAETSEDKPLGTTPLPVPVAPPKSSRIDAPAESVAIVNGEVISYRDLVRWGMSLKELDGAINLLLLKQAAKCEKLDITSQDIDAEVQRQASSFKLAIDQWYSMIEKERGTSRDHYREFAIWPQLVLKRLAGDDPKQQLTFLAGLRAAAKIELVDPDAKLHPIKTETEQPKEPPPTNNENSPAVDRVERF